LINTDTKAHGCEGDQANSTKNKESVHHSESSNLFLDLARREHVREQCKKAVKEIHMNQLTSKELPHKEVVNNQLRNAGKQCECRLIEHGRDLQQ